MTIGADEQSRKRGATLGKVRGNDKCGLAASTSPKPGGRGRERRATAGNGGAPKSGPPSPQVGRFVTDYLADLRALLAEIESGAVSEMVAILLEAWKTERHVLLMGNGGSGSSASHIVNDLQKNLALEAGKPLRALCLSDCTPLLMAWANDTAWENIFAPQVECWAQPGDVVMGISGSGNSMNVVNGITTANRLGAVTLGLAGYEGGKLKDVCARCIIVRSRNMQQIEDAHMALLHVIFSALLCLAKASRNG